MPYQDRNKNGRITGGEMDSLTREAQGYLSHIKSTTGVTVSFQRDDGMRELYTPYEVIQIGSLQFIDLSPKTLHELAKHRNFEVVQMARRYARLVGSLGTSRDIMPKNNGIVHRELNSPMLQNEYQPYTHRIAREAKIASQGSGGYKYSEQSYVNVFFVPALPDYLETYENIPVSDYKASHENEGALLSWKNFIVRHDTPATAFFRKSLEAYLPFESFKESVYVLGAKKSGKTEFLKTLVHQIISSKMPKNEKVSGLILDPHGDFAKEASRWKECYKNERVILFDPTIKDNASPSIDIFAVPSKDNRTVNMYATEFADAFSEAIGGELTLNMKVVLEACLDVIYRRDGSSMYDLQRFMIEGQADDLIELGKNSPNRAVAEFFRTAFDLKKFNTTKEALYTKIQTLRSSEVFTRIFNPKGTLDLEKELNSGKFIIVNLSRGAMSKEVSQVFGRLLVAMVKSIGFRRESIPKNQRPETYVFIDEFQNFVGESIEEVLSESRKYGLYLILAHQLLGQRMSAKLQKAIFSGTAVKIVGKNDPDNLSVMARQLGADMSELTKLTTGKFCVHVRSGKKPTEPFLFYSSTHLLGGRNAMSPRQWRETLVNGWTGYVSNRTLDNVYERATETPREELKGFSEGVSTSEGAQDALKPKFDI